MSRWRWILLIFELVLFAAILVLPQVELPDFTFHGGTSPVVMKARLAPGAMQDSMVVPTSLPVPLPFFEVRAQDDSYPPVADVTTRLSLLCTLNC